MTTLALPERQHAPTPFVRRVACTVAAAAAATVLIVAVPNLRFAYADSTLKIACETTAAFGAALAAFLVVGRSRLQHVDESLLASGLGLLAVADMLLVLLPSRVGSHTTTLRVITWIPLGMQLLAAVLLCTAARDDARRARPLAPARVTGSIVAALFVIIVAPLVFALPSDTARTISIASAAKPQLQREPFVAAVQLLIAVFLLGACIGFTRRADRDGDRFASWVALGCGLTAVARLNLALFPSLFSRWLYSGDIMRLAGYGCWLIGSAVEIASYWRSLAASAVIEERRRVARNLHDGLAQDLAYLNTELRSWPASERQNAAASAAERALGEARRAIAALSDSFVPFDEALRRTVEEIALRHGARAVVTTELETVPPPETIEQLLRIAREATVNAFRHGHAREVQVSISQVSSTRCLQVIDDGVGFDGDATSTRGFGLGFMRERAQVLGGELEVRSAPGRGCEIRLTW